MNADLMFNNVDEWENVIILFTGTANLGYLLTNCWQFQKIKILNPKNLKPSWHMYGNARLFLIALNLELIFLKFSMFLSKLAVLSAEKNC